MALEPRRLYLETQSRGFLASPGSSIPASEPLIFREDIEAVHVFVLRRTGDPTRPHEFLDPSGATVKLAIGVDEPAVLQTAWTPIPTTPTIGVTTLVTGSLGVSEVQKVAISDAEPVEGGFVLQFPARNVTVSGVAAGVFSAPSHGLYDGMSVTPSGFTGPTNFANGTSYIVRGSTKDTFGLAASLGGAILNASVSSGGGTMAVASIATGGIPFDATPAQVQSAIAAAGFVFDGSPQITVTGAAGRYYTLVFGGRSSGRAHGAVEVVGSTLVGAPGLAANVTFNTTELTELLEENVEEVFLEVEISEGANRHTFRRSARISADIIASSSPVPLPEDPIPTSFQMESPNGTVFTLSVTNDGEIQLAEV